MCGNPIFDYHRQHGVDIRVARIFNTYGPRMHPNDGRVVSNFIVQALRGQDITIFGEGSQTRSFCYVNDLIDAFIRFMNPDQDNEALKNIQAHLIWGTQENLQFLNWLKQLSRQLDQSRH